MVIRGHIISERDLDNRFHCNDCVIELKHGDTGSSDDRDKVSLVSLAMNRHAAKEDDETVAVRLAVPRDLLDCGELGATSESIILQAARHKSTNRTRSASDSFSSWCGLNFAVGSVDFTFQMAIRPSRCPVMNCFPSWCQKMHVNSAWQR